MNSNPLEDFHAITAQFTPQSANGFTLTPHHLSISILIFYHNQLVNLHHHYRYAPTYSTLQFDAIIIALQDLIIDLFNENTCQTQYEPTLYDFLLILQARLSGTHVTQRVPRGHSDNIDQCYGLIIQQLFKRMILSISHPLLLHSYLIQLSYCLPPSSFKRGQAMQYANLTKGFTYPSYSPFNSILQLYIVSYQTITASYSQQSEFLAQIRSYIYHTWGFKSHHTGQYFSNHIRYNTSLLSKGFINTTMTSSHEVHRTSKVYDTQSRTNTMNHHMNDPYLHNTSRHSQNTVTNHNIPHSTSKQSHRPLQLTNNPLNTSLLSTYSAIKPASHSQGFPHTPLHPSIHDLPGLDDLNLSHISAFNRSTYSILSSITAPRHTPLRRVPSQPHTELHPSLPLPRYKLEQLQRTLPLGTSRLLPSPPPALPHTPHQSHLIDFYNALLQAERALYSDALFSYLRHNNFRPHQLLHGKEHPLLLSSLHHRLGSFFAAFAALSAPHISPMSAISAPDSNISISSSANAPLPLSSNQSEHHYLSLLVTSSFPALHASAFTRDNIPIVTSSFLTALSASQSPLVATLPVFDSALEIANILQHIIERKLYVLFNNISSDTIKAFYELLRNVNSLFQRRVDHRLDSATQVTTARHLPAASLAQLCAPTTIRSYTAAHSFVPLLAPPVEPSREIKKRHPQALNKDTARRMVDELTHLPTLNTLFNKTSAQSVAFHQNHALALSDKISKTELTPEVVGNKNETHLHQLSTPALSSHWAFLQQHNIALSNPLNAMQYFYERAQKLLAQKNTNYSQSLRYSIYYELYNIDQRHFNKFFSPFPLNDPNNLDNTSAIITNINIYIDKAQIYYSMGLPWLSAFYAVKSYQELLFTIYNDQTQVDSTVLVRLLDATTSDALLSSTLQTGNQNSPHHHVSFSTAQHSPQHLGLRPLPLVSLAAFSRPGAAAAFPLAIFREYSNILSNLTQIPDRSNTSPLLKPYFSIASQTYIYRTPWLLLSPQNQHHAHHCTAATHTPQLPSNSPNIYFLQTSVIYLYRYNELLRLSLHFHDYFSQVDLTRRLLVIIPYYYMQTVTSLQHGNSLSGSNMLYSLFVEIIQNLAQVMVMHHNHYAAMFLLSISLQQYYPLAYQVNSGASGANLVTMLSHLYSFTQTHFASNTHSVLPRATTAYESTLPHLYHTAINTFSTPLPSILRTVVTSTATIPTIIIPAFPTLHGGGGSSIWSLDPFSRASHPSPNLVNIPSTGRPHIGGSVGSGYHIDNILSTIVPTTTIQLQIISQVFSTLWAPTAASVPLLPSLGVSPTYHPTLAAATTISPNSLLNMLFTLSRVDGMNVSTITRTAPTLEMCGRINDGGFIAPSIPLFTPNPSAMQQKITLMCQSLITLLSVVNIDALIEQHISTLTYTAQGHADRVQSQREMLLDYCNHPNLSPRCDMVMTLPLTELLIKLAMQFTFMLGNAEIATTLLSLTTPTLLSASSYHQWVIENERYQADLARYKQVHGGAVERNIQNTTNFLPSLFTPLMYPQITRTKFTIYNEYLLMAWILVVTINVPTVNFIIPYDGCEDDPSFQQLFHKNHRNAGLLQALLQRCYYFAFYTHNTQYIPVVMYLIITLHHQVGNSVLRDYNIVLLTQFSSYLCDPVGVMMTINNNKCKKNANTTLQFPHNSSSIDNTSQKQQEQVFDDEFEDWSNFSDQYQYHNQSDFHDDDDCQWALFM